MARPLIFGIGNPDRGDDAAGSLVAGLLSSRGVPARPFSGDTVGLLELWSHEDDVILVDASVSGQPPGTVAVIDVLKGEAASRPPVLSSHALGLWKTLELARVLERLPRSLRIYAVEGAVFSFGAPPTQAVVHGCHAAATRILDSLLRESLPADNLIDCL